MISTGRSTTLRTNLFINWIEVGSIQCVSSKITRTGPWVDSRTSCSSSKSMVRCFWTGSVFRRALQHGFQLIELLGSGICADDARSPFQLPDERIKRAVDVKGRAE